MPGGGNLKYEGFQRAKREKQGAGGRGTGKTRMSGWRAVRSDREIMGAEQKLSLCKVIQVKPGGT